MLLPVIMAGGTGSRLWPMSRELYPKQFLRLFGQNSMLQETITRLSGLEIHEPMVICNEEHRFLVAEQLRQLNKLSNNIILEPVGRNTAPAIALAALQATRDGDDPLMLVLAADHIINNQSAFHDAIRVAEQYADEGHLVTFGIVPNAPETGYGYIQRGVALTDSAHSAYQVARFVEKPDRERAEAYLASGEYYWNSGMFMFRAKKYLIELAKYRPDILEACQAAVNAADNGSESRMIFSASARMSPWTMPLWRKPPMRWWSVSMLTGATSAPGPHYGRSARETSRAMSSAVTRGYTTAKTATSTATRS